MAPRPWEHHPGSDLREDQALAPAEAVGPAEEVLGGDGSGGRGGENEEWELSLETGLVKGDGTHGGADGGENGGAGGGEDAGADEGGHGDAGIGAGVAEDAAGGAGGGAVGGCRWGKGGSLCEERVGEENRRLESTTYDSLCKRN